MKQKVLIAVLFLTVYLMFLLARLPATLVVRHLPLPPNLVQLEGVSGTLWSGQIARLQYASESLTQLRWELDGCRCCAWLPRCRCVSASAPASMARG